jgi:hypothetical protein
MGGLEWLRHILKPRSVSEVRMPSFPHPGDEFRSPTLCFAKDAAPSFEVERWKRGMRHPPPKIRSVQFRGAQMEKQLLFEKVYEDADVIEIKVTVWNGAFGGITNVYIGRNKIGELASGFRGFPSTSLDFREATLGAFGADSAGGGVHLTLFCADPVGHVFVNVKIENDCDSKNRAESANLLLRTEASAVDAFIGELQDFDAGKVTSASLKAVGL